MCDRAFEEQSRGLMKTATVPVTVRVISAGKLRRYSHMSLRQHLLSWHVVGNTIADSLKLGWGFLQSLGLLLRHRPAVVFAKGGYVCLPVGLAAYVLRIPLVIHDSDSRPGLTNRALSRFARRIATGFPLHHYPYKPAISRYVGVPIDEAFRPVDARTRATYKKALDYAADQPLVVVTGGGLGARSINQAMVAAAPQLAEKGIGVYHVAGAKQYDAVTQALAAQSPDDGGYTVVPFVYEAMEKVLGAADVVVARGSATFLQEMAGIGTAVVIIPAKQLGDQLKNGRMYQQAGAALVLSDDEIARPGVLGDALVQLIDDEARRQTYAEKLHAFARPHAARDTAELILEVVPDEAAMS